MIQSMIGVKINNLVFFEILATLSCVDKPLTIVENPAYYSTSISAIVAETVSESGNKLPEIFVISNKHETVVK